MKFRIGVAILAFIALLIGVCAATSSTASMEVKGNIGSQITVVAPSNMENWNFAGGDNSQAGTLTLTSNDRWGLNVKSDQSDGRMKEFNGGYVQGGKSLQFPMWVECNGIGGVRGHGFHNVQLTADDQALIDAGSWDAVQTNTPCDIKFFQTVNYPASDTRVTPPGRYHIVVTFTGFIQY
jgi:hypothetical protein